MSHPIFLIFFNQFKWDINENVVNIFNVSDDNFHIFCLLL